uniref:amino acid transporter AVT1E-like n=1 Tax=Ciona intestinalis TaxID=7719 RepID=UPI000180CAB9|nr:amino acid transporter AVT1E-like [Ciona intestinalis]|eukprot:XP_009858997.1 amino acid transporter AVT1E-like [Ciona intestinalis]
MDHKTPEAVELMGNTNGSYDNEKEEKHAPPVSGLTVITAVLFITGEMTGSGVLALPKAVKDAGWVGIFLIFMCAGISSFTGTVLGRCWTLLRENKPELRGHCADPYPTIGFNTFGKPGKIIVNISVYFTLYGVCVVLLLIASGNVQSLLSQVNVDMSLCYWVMIIGGALAPFCWLKSPKDFWPIALGATVTTVIACILIFIQAMMDVEKAHNATVAHIEQGEVFERGFETFFLAFGMILFCFGGMAAFPTIQADMREPSRFPKAVIVAMASILCMYIPVGAAGFAVYGDLVADNIFDSLTQGPMKSVATVLITMHLVFAYVIIQNPLSQVFEMPLNLPDEFGLKRVLVRTSITVVVIFTAESCPRFGHILALVGGSAVTLNTFVFPSIFFWKITRMHGKEWEGATMPKWEIPLHVIIITIGVIGGVSATYSAIRGITDPTAFVPPCYVNITAASAMGGGGGSH